MKGVILVLCALGVLLVCNVLFSIVYCRYFAKDTEFLKWSKSHWCVNRVMLWLSSIFNFKLHRLIYSKFLEKDEFSLLLISIRKLTPISILSLISIAGSSVLVLVAAALAVYYSLNKDQ
jgi:hypothetical protein